MPTGYTVKVTDGRVTTLHDFALSCAKAFGACIDMWDDDFDKPIPDEFKVSPYYTEKLAEAQQQLAEIAALTPAKVEAAAEEAFNVAQDAYETTKYTFERENARLAEMVEKVKAWTPPTQDHAGLKNFMLQQLDSSKVSLEYLTAPIKHSGPDWQRKRIEDLHRDVAYYAEAAAKELERVNERNAWLKTLRGAIQKGV